MKILWITSNITVVGGVEQVICGLSNYFCQNFGYEIEIVSTQTDDGTAFFPLDSRIKIRHYGLHWQDQNRRTLLRAVQDILRTSDADFLITCHASYSTPALLSRHLFRGKIIVTQHCQFESESPRRRLVSAALFHLADRFIVLTENDRKGYARLGLKASVIPNAVFNPPRSLASLSERCILSVGRFEEVKGFDRLIAAFAKASSGCPDWKLCLCGDGMDMEKLKAAAAENHVTDRVLFPGFVSNPSDYMEHAGIFACSSHNEGFPLVCLDAMTHGLPVVSFDIPAIREITTPQCAEIVPQDDLDGFAAALKKLMQAQPLREQMGKAAREQARQYSLPRVAAQWQSLFRQLLA